MKRIAVACIAVVVAVAVVALSMFAIRGRDISATSNSNIAIATPEFAARPILGPATAHAAVVAQQRSDTIVRIAGAPRHAGIASLIEELSIGSATGPDEYLFSRVSMVLPRRNGNILVLDSPLSAGRGGGQVFLREYDERGQYVRTVGRTGGGPGEFRRPVDVGELPDGRILVRDDQLQGILIYSPTGVPAGQWEIPERTLALTTGTAPLADARGNVFRPLALRERERFESPTAVPAAFLRLRIDGTIIDTLLPPVIATAPTYDRALYSATRGGSGVSYLAPYFPHTVWTWSSLGYLITGVPTRYAFELRIPSQPGRVWRQGDPVTSIRREVSPVPVSAAERTAKRENMESRLRARDPSWTWRGDPVPTVKPAYIAIRTGQDGRIWVRASQPSIRVEQPAQSAEFPYIEPNFWDVFEPDGAFVGGVRLPDTLYRFEARGDQVWGSITDADGVPIVKRWRIGWK